MDEINSQYARKADSQLRTIAIAIAFTLAMTPSFSIADNVISTLDVSGNARQSTLSMGALEVITVSRPLPAPKIITIDIK